MNEVVANYLIEKIAAESWVHKLSGIVKPFIRMDYLFDEELESNIPVRNIYPVSCKLSFEECSSSAYSELMPNSSFRSVAYFEDNGSEVYEYKKNNSYIKSRLRFVCWLNMNLIEHTGCTISDQIIPRVISLFHQSKPTNYSGVVELTTRVVSVPKKDANIFGQYTYNQEISQYLLYPYDYFALDIEATYAIPPIECYAELATKDEC